MAKEEMNSTEEAVEKEILKEINGEIDNKSKGGILKYIVWALMLIEMIASVVLLTHLMTKDMLPTKFDVILIVAIVLFNVGMFFSVKNKAVAIIMLALSVIITVICIVGSVVISKIDKTIDSVSSKDTYETVQMVLVVRAKDKAKTVEDVAGYKIGITTNEEATDKFVKKIDDKLAKSDKEAARYKEYESFVAATSALTSKRVDAMCINSQYIEVVKEIEGYENFDQEVRIVYTEEIKVEKKSELETVKKRKAIDEEGKFIVYLSGIDSYGSIKVKSRSDVNILAVVNTKSGDIQLINTPRDYYVSFPTKGNAKDKLTHAGMYGVETSLATLEELYDTGINYYFRINFSGFEKIIDELGGIDVYSEKSFSGTGSVSGYSFSKGKNHLNGKAALAFARTRKAFAQGDVQRGKNQMAVIRAVINKMTSTEFLKKYDKVLDKVDGCFQTDIPSKVLYGLVKEQLATNPSWNIESMTVAGRGTKSTTYSIPGLKSYVMIPNEQDVNKAKELIEDTLEKDK